MIKAVVFASKPTLLITGAHGLIGSYIAKHPTLKEQFTILMPPRAELELTDLNQVKQFFFTYQPQYVIHLAAHRNATTAEEQRGDLLGSAWKSNVIGTENLARLCKEYSSLLVHISTDYVFAGLPISPGPYLETTHPEKNDAVLSWYGITKREAEARIQAIIPNSAIIRINNVTQPGFVNQLDYIGKIIWLYQQQKMYPMFTDQKVTLTHIPHLLQAMLVILNKKLTGIFHVASTDTCTPHQLARYSIEQIHSQVVPVEQAYLEQYLELYPRRYPQFDGLSSAATQKATGLHFGTWQDIVAGFWAGSM